MHKLNANTTLANFIFRKIFQLQNESFDLFVIRIKREAEACKFTSASDTCTAKTTMIRDQLIIGTREDTIKQEALEEPMPCAHLLQQPVEGPPDTN